MLQKTHHESHLAKLKPVNQKARSPIHDHHDVQHSLLCALLNISGRVDDILCACDVQYEALQQLHFTALSLYRGGESDAFGRQHVQHSKRC
jgi:hypothetical protein